MSFPKEWYDLFDLKWSTNKLDELYLAVKIERIKKYLSNYRLETYLDYKFYDKVITVNNYYLYEKDFNKYFDNYKRLERILDNISNILCYIDEFYDGNDKETIKKDILF